jgi:hypothetical protein
MNMTHSFRSHVIKLTDLTWQVLKDKEGKEMDTIRIDSWSHDTIADFFKERLA